MRRTAVRLAGVLIGGGLLWLAAARTDWGLLGKALVEADLPLVAGAVLLRLLTFPLRSFRWDLTLRPSGYRGGWRGLFSPLMAGFFTNYVLPVKSGELVRALLLGRHGLSAGGGLATIAVERVLDLATLLFLLWWASLVVPVPGWVGVVGFSAATLMVGGIILLGIMAGHSARMASFLDGALRRIGFPWHQRVARAVAKVEEGLGVLRRRHLLGAGLAVSLLIWAVNVTGMMAAGLAAGVRLPLSTWILLTVVFNLSTLVPSLPGRLGTMEFIFVTVLGLFGLDAARAMAVAVLVRVTHVAPLALGYLCLLREGIHPFRRGEREDGPA
jgi:hypothetical protein